MAQLKYSANLSAADFVLSHTYKGRSVIVPGIDQNYFQGTSGWAGDTPQRGIDIPQVYYCENTVPTSEGYRSVAYRYFIEPPTTSEKFVKILTVFDGYAASAVIGITADRKLFIVSAFTGGVWQVLTLPEKLAVVGDEVVGTGTYFTWTADELVTLAVVNGNVVLCIENVGFFILEVSNNLLRDANVFVRGIDPTKIKGVCSSHSYLVAFDDTTVYWSSTEDGLDFVPSLITGAGSAKPDGGKGRIVLCKEISGGFIIYFEACIISAAYSSNLAIPWIFDILAGGAGIRTANAVAYDLNTTTHFAWTSAGLLGVELHQSKGMFPQVTDFIGSGLSDKTTSYTDYPTSEFLDEDKEVRLAVIAARYLCISFGTLPEPITDQIAIPKLVQSFLYDIQLKRWGKLNIDHVQIFEAPFTAVQPVFF